jgi:hypothetical protein
MTELVKRWKWATSATKSKHANRAGRLSSEREKRISRAIILIKRGTISRAGRALESKGLGDLGNPEIMAQMQAKHPARQREIGQAIYAFVADEELQISIEKILPKLDLNAAPGPSGFWNGYLRIWTGVFAPSSAKEATWHLETLITGMANDMTPGGFMQAMQAADIIAIVKDNPA